MTLHMHPAIPSSYSSLNTFGDCGARFVICCCVATFSLLNLNLEDQNLGGCFSITGGRP